VVGAGDVDTLFRDRGRRGVIGAEFDRLGPALGVGLATSPEESCFEGVCDVCGFAASPKDLRVALMTWVASAAFSFSDNSPRPCCDALAFAGPDLPPVAGLDGADRGPFVADGFVADGFVAGDGSVSERSSSLRMLAVAALQVAVDDTAARTSSISGWDAIGGLITVIPSHAVRQGLRGNSSKEGLLKEEAKQQKSNAHVLSRHVVRMRLKIGRGAKLGCIA